MQTLDVSFPKEGWDPGQGTVSAEGALETFTHGDCLLTPLPVAGQQILPQGGSGWHIFTSGTSVAFSADPSWPWPHKPACPGLRPICSLSADSLWLLAQKLCLTVQSLELRIVMLSPGDMFRDALCGHGDWKALLSIPVPLDVVPPQPKPHPIPSLPCPVLPSPRVWLLVGIPKELPVEKRRLEERDCSHARWTHPHVQPQPQGRHTVGQTVKERIWFYVPISARQFQLLASDAKRDHLIWEI